MTMHIEKLPSQERQEIKEEKIKGKSVRPALGEG